VHTPPVAFDTVNASASVGADDTLPYQITVEDGGTRRTVSFADDGTGMHGTVSDQKGGAGLGAARALVAAVTRAR
jgi:hypothetical protein